MSGLNRVTLIGNLGKDPEQRTTQNGKIFVNLSVGTSDSWKDKSTGERKESTEWHKVVFFDRQAEVICDYMRKGSKIYVEGQLRTRKWQDSDGNDRWTTEIVGRNFLFLDGKGKSETQTQQQKIQADDLDADVPW